MRDVDEMVRTYGGMVWGVCCRVAGREGAEDCFQEVFVAAAGMLGRGEKVWSWEGMLRRLAVRKGVDTVRRRIRERGRMGGDVEEVLGRDDLPGRVIEMAEAVEGLRRALAEVSPEQAEVFVLRHVEGRSYEEIGEAVGMSANAVGVMLTRTKGRLRELLERRTEKGEVFHG